MKNFLIWSFTFLMTVVAGASYFVPELVNLVAAYGVLTSTLGIVCSLLLLLLWLGYDESNPNPRLVEGLRKTKETISNPLKRFINTVNKLVVAGALIYHGWVFTGVFYGVVMFVTYLQFKSIRKMELPKLEN